MRHFKRHTFLPAFLAVWLTVETAVGPALLWAQLDTLRPLSRQENKSGLEELTRRLAPKATNPAAGLEEKTDSIAEETVDGSRLAEYLSAGAVTEGMVNDVAWKLSKKALDEVLRILWDQVWRSDPYWRNFKREQEFTIQLGDYGTRKVGISDYLFEILRHPLANAADAWADQFRNTRRYQGGEIKIRAFIGKGNLTIQILDKGPGVPKEFRRLLGKRKIQSPKQGKTGTSGEYGLGILKATRIAKVEGWRFTVSGRKNAKGTVASLVIPLNPRGSSASGLEERAREQAEQFIRGLVPTDRALVPVVILGGLEEQNPVLSVLRRLGKRVPVIFAREMTPEEVALKLIADYDARYAIVAGLEEELPSYTRALEGANISAQPIPPSDPGRLLLRILARMAGLEEQDLLDRDVGRLLDNLAILGRGA